MLQYGIKDMGGTMGQVDLMNAESFGKVLEFAHKAANKYAQKIRQEVLSTPEFKSLGLGQRDYICKTIARELSTHFK